MVIAENQSIYSNGSWYTDKNLFLLLRVMRRTYSGYFRNPIQHSIEANHLYGLKCIKGSFKFYQIDPKGLKLYLF